MSVQSSLLHSTCTNSVGLCRRALKKGLKNAGVRHWSSHNFVELEKGEKGQLHQGDSIVEHTLQLISTKEGRRQWTSTIISRPRIRIKRALLARTVPLTFVGNGLIDKRQKLPGSSYSKSFQYVACYIGIRGPSRAAIVDCTPDNNYLSKGKAWKDGPYGVVWEAEDIAQAVDGLLVTSASPGSISTDSRRINQGEWFLALVGPNFDGHQFLQQAFDRGCAGVIGRAVSNHWPRGFISVEDDTLRALHRLAACVRRRYGGAVVGITGSTGKTTARAMTALALESLGTIHQSEGNFNNHIGLPLTLLKLPSTSSACVLEMGMNHAGEILVLAEIARPSVRVLLNVGPAHMEHFSSLEDVAAAKGELLSEAMPGDVCVLNADDPLVMSLAIPRGVRVVLFGRQDGCHLKIANALPTRGGRSVSVVLEQFYPASTWVEQSSSGSQILENLRQNSSKSNVDDFESSGTCGMSCDSSYGADLQLKICTNSGIVNLASDEDFVGIERCSSPSGLNLITRVEFELPSPGVHLALNACAAAAVAVSLGVPLQTAAKSLSKYFPIGMRSRWEEVGDGRIQLINDAYNCNPMSIDSGLKLLGSMECQGRKVALLGDMLELGSVSKKAHFDTLALCQELNLDKVGLVGPSFSEAACSQGLDKGERCTFLIYKDSQELASKVVEILRPGDVVLVKGSRGMKMEMVANAIRTSAWTG